MRGIPGEEADCHGMQSFRRGATQEIAESSPDLYQLLTAGSWNNNAFKAHMDMQRLLGAGQKRMIPLGEDSDDSAGDDEVEV